MSNALLPSNSSVALGLSACVLGLVALAVLQIYLVLARTQETKRFEAALIANHQCQAPKRLTYGWPFGIDLIVEAFKADRAGKVMSFFLYQFERTGHTFEQVILGGHGIGTRDPQNLEAILSTQFDGLIFNWSEFGLGTRSDNFRSLLGNGIFTQDGDAWKSSRDLLRPQFMQTRTKSFVDIQRVIERFVSALEATPNKSLDLQPLFFRLTLDTTMAVLFGKSGDGSRIQGEDEETAFARAFDHAQHRIASRGRLGDFYWLLGGKAFWDACKKTHNFVDEIVAEALEESDSKPSQEPERYVFLTELIKKTRDPVVLRDQLINVLLAGRDTTGCLLSWTLNVLASQQEIQHELRNECVSLPSYKSGDLPTSAEIKGMRYLHNVLREVLRLYPSVPCNTRFALKTTTLPVGGGPDGLSPIIVRKGEGVGYSPYVLHRRKDIYGEDATSFRPSRWEDGVGDGPDLRGVGYGYLPFNGGPRVCPGQEFGLLEASYTVIRLLQKFRHIEKPDSRPFQENYNVTLVLTNADGCKVVLTPYDD